MSQINKESRRHNPILITDSSSFSCEAPTGGTKHAMLPLPIAAFVSLTITFKVDKSLEYINGVAGQALASSAIGCLWPIMPIIGALWSQKVRRWHNFIVVMCASSFFTQDKEAVAQLTRSCFSSFIGSSDLDFHQTAHRGVSGLLGQAFTGHRTCMPISPGILYLQSCRTFHDAHFVSDLILRLVVEQAREPANSFAVAADRARTAAILGASLLCIAGGVQVVQVLYEETLPTYLLSEKEGEEAIMTKYESHVLGGGYGMACMVLFCGALVWGVGKVSPAYTSIFYSKRARVVGAHVDFLTGVVEGKVPPGCDIAMLRVYVLCLVSLMVRFVPGWVSDVKPEMLKRLATGLRGWGEGNLALALLEKGGSASVEFVVESLSGLNYFEEAGRMG